MTAPIDATPEDVEVFEKNHPMLEGIGAIMVRKGKWKVVRTEETALPAAASGVSS